MANEPPKQNSEAWCFRCLVFGHVLACPNKTLLIKGQEQEDARKILKKLVNKSNIDEIQDIDEE